MSVTVLVEVEASDEDEAGDTLILIAKLVSEGYRDSLQRNEYGSFKFEVTGGPEGIDDDQ